MKPTDALLFQRILLDDVRRFPRDETVYYNGDHAGQFIQDCSQALATVLPDAATYFVSADMAAVAKHAAMSMPFQMIRRGDCPAATGFIMWSEPVYSFERDGRRLETVGAVWADRVEPVYSCDCRTDDCEHNPDVEYGVEVIPLARGQRASELWPMSRLTMNDSSQEDVGVQAGGAVDAEHGEDIEKLLRVLLATWTLMGQSLTRSERMEGDRAERRRWSRVGLSPQPVTVVRLRRIGNHACDEGETNVPWSHRWIVSGHWRNQWLPSRDCHRLQWIAAHVKGPDGAPLVVKDRVTALVR